MQFCFVLPQGYETKDLIALNRIFVKRGKIRRWIVPMLHIAMSVYGGALLISGLGILIPGETLDLKYLHVAILPLILGVFLLCLGLFSYRIGACFSKRSMIRNMGGITVSISESGVLEQLEKKGTTYRNFSAYVDAACYRDRYFLFVDKSHAIILPKCAITEGTTNDFEKCWQKWSGIPIVYQ